MEEDAERAEVSCKALNEARLNAMNSLLSICIVFTKTF